MYGVLSGSQGYIRDEFFLIDSPNPTIGQFLKIPTHSKAVKQALFTITGKQYKLGLYNKSNNNEQKKSDPFEDLINKARGNSNIEIQ